MQIQDCRSCNVRFDVICFANIGDNLVSGDLPGLGTLTEESGGEEEQGQGPGRSFLYNNFAAGAARKPNSSVWKRELLVAGHRQHCSKLGFTSTT